MDIEKKLEQIKARYEEISNAMADPGIYEKPDEYAELNKEHSSQQDLVSDYNRWKEIKEQILVSLMRMTIYLLDSSMTSS